MKNKSLFWVASLATVLAGPVAAAQTDAEEIVVTATRLPTAADAVTAAVSVLTEEDLERRQATFLLDQLATIPGVVVSQNGPFGGQATVRIRGAGADQTLVLIDGVAVNDPTAPNGGFNPAFLDAADIARVEVLRGPQSTLWGSDAIGGVVNIVTRRPPAGFSGVASAEAGSFETRRAVLSGAFGGERLDVRLGGVVLRSDGVSKADEDDGARETDPYESDILDGRIGFDVSAALRLEAFGRLTDSETAFDRFGAVTGVRDGDDVGVSEERSGGLIARLNALDGRLESAFVLSRADIERRNRSNGRQTFVAEGFREAWRYQGALQATDALRVAFGAEREESKVERSGSTRIDGLFLLAEAKPADTLILTAGVRRDDHSTFGDESTVRVGARWSLRPSLALRGSFGQGFKAPTIFQLVSFFPPATAPNRDLQPEEAEGWDLAAILRTADGRFEGEVGVFGLKTENQISFAAGRYVNIARVESQGVEAAARVAITPRLALAASYAFTDAENPTTGAALIRIPEHAAFLEADWRPTESLGLTATVRHNGEEPDLNTGPFPARPVVNDAWTRLDVAARYALNQRVELYGRVENLSDENYQDLFGYGAPGRAAFAGVRLRIE